VDIPSVVVEIHGRIHRMGIDDCYQGRAGGFEGRQEKGHFSKNAQTARGERSCREYLPENVEVRLESRSFVFCWFLPKGRANDVRNDAIHTLPTMRINLPRGTA
jgi:hypothetical protein